MRLTGFGFFWLALICVCFARKEHKYMIMVTLLGMTLQSSSVVMLGETGVGPQIITSLAFLVWYCLKITLIERRGVWRLAINKLSLSKLSAVALFIVIIISRKINVDSYKMDSTLFHLLVIQLFVYILVAFSMSQLMLVISEEEFDQVVQFIIWIVVIFGAIQLAATTGVFDRKILWGIIGYVSSPYFYYYDSNYFFRITSTFLEPSYLSVFLVGAFFYVLSNKRITTSRIFFIAIIFIEIILTFSTTAYVAFVITGLFYLLFGNNKKILNYLLPLIIIGVALLAVNGTLSRILNDVVFHKIHTGSYRTRNALNIRALKHFRSSIYFGVGYKNSRASSLFNSILDQLGITGMMTWVGIWLPIICSGFLERKESDYLNAATLMLIGGLSSLIIAVPDIDSCGFWLEMYIVCFYFSSYACREDLMQVSEQNC